MIFIVYCVLSVTMIWKRKQLLIKLLNLNFSNWNICRMAGGWQFWWYDNIWYSVFLSVTIWYDEENKFWPNFWKLKYLQDGRRVARPQSVADMEELGRDLENMQIVNSRLVRIFITFLIYAFWKYVKRKELNQKKASNMEKLGRDLENMQIGNFRLVAEYLWYLKCIYFKNM